MIARLFQSIFIIALSFTLGCNDTRKEARSAASSPTAVRTADKTTHIDEWSVRIAAKRADGVVFSDIRLGIVESRTDGRRRTLEAFVNPGARLDIHFQSDDRNVSALFFGAEEDKHIWPFVVRSNDNNAVVTLYWSFNGLKSRYDAEGRKRYEPFAIAFHPVMLRMRLKDVDRNVFVPATINGNVATYTFSMDGETTRHFQWHLEDSPVTGLETKYPTMRAPLQTNPLRTHRKVSENNDLFDPNEPPFLRDGFAGEAK
jgi:hypothetical protein